MQGMDSRYGFKVWALQTISSYHRRIAVKQSALILRPD